MLLLEVRDLVKTFPVACAEQRSARGVWPFGRKQSLLHAVDGVGFTVGKGETVGLVGESGCGKSTVTRLVTRLLDPSSGSLLFEGNDLGAISANVFATHPLRPQIQMVFQDATDSINPRFSAFTAIADPVRRWGRERSRRAVREQVLWAAEKVGLPEELLERLPHQLSGGQRARVGIARGVVLRPRLLVLDEPTSSLDVSVQARVLGLLDQLRRELVMAYLFVSHDLNLVRLLCDRVMVMYLGQIVESGPAETVFRAPAHPYTKALVSAIPDIDARARGAKLRLEGEPESPVDIGRDFCRFIGRCPRAETRCRSEMPALRSLSPGREVACHFPLEVGAGDGQGAEPVPP